METKIINDPIWGPIELHPLCIMIINTPQFQRLRSIKQLGGCSFVYPGACHSRFEHSIGTSYLARRLGEELQKKISPQESSELEITKKEILCLEVAGLCHDLGHGPFSHLFDLQFFKKANKSDEQWEHEDASIKMISWIFDTNPQSYVNDEDIKFIKDLIKKTKETCTEKRKTKPFLYEIIANDLNKIDVDKWDYFSRDCHMLGLHHNFQCERSIKLARLVKHNGKYHISFPKSEYFNLFDMFYTRFTLHRRAYQHSVTKAVELMIADAFLQANESLKFPPNQEKQIILSESMKDMEAYLWVTDDVLNQIRTLNADGNKKIKKAQEIVDRIYHRDFYKVIGEKRVKWKDESKPTPKISLKKWMEEKLTTDKELFEIQEVVFHYGSGKTNPMNDVKLHRNIKEASWKENGTEHCNEDKGNKSTISKRILPAVMTNDEISDMLPTKFQQSYLRLIWKGDTSAESYRNILMEFSEIKEYEIGKDIKVDFIDTMPVGDDKRCEEPVKVLDQQN